MKQALKHPLEDTPDNLMKRAGYVRHCTEAGRACFHRRLSEDEFPRFHAYVSLGKEGMEIDLHFDQFDSLTHKGNHDKEWAYHGGRVTGEMKRIFAILQEQHPKKVNQSTTRTTQPPQQTQKKKRLFDVLFR